MFFGAGSNEDRIKWMEAIRLGILSLCVEVASLSVRNELME